MNWHIKDRWGAYTWDKNLFPYPNDTMKWLKDQGLFISFNIHDDDGIYNYEDQFVPFC